MVLLKLFFILSFLYFLCTHSASVESPIMRSNAENGKSMYRHGGDNDIVIRGDLLILLSSFSLCP